MGCLPSFLNCGRCLPQFYVSWSSSTLIVGIDMQIRNLFICVLLFATMVPSTIFGVWAYRDGVQSEFSDVSDRHLLIARNLGDALKRYCKDLEALSISVSAALEKWDSYPNIDETLQALNIDYIALLDRDTGELTASVQRSDVELHAIPKATFDLVKSEISAKQKGFAFTTVQPSTDADGVNVMYAVRNMGQYISVTRINTAYFIKLGKSVSFGTKGHAAIVDRDGNVLAHPLDNWIRDRKNISKISTVQRMMQGETGVQQFYSPALKGDMIAGFTAVPGVGWGVMIPQPVSELYAKVAENNQGVLIAIAAGIAITIGLFLVILKILGKPLKALTYALHTNAQNGVLDEIELPKSQLMLQEVDDFQKAYNGLVKEVKSANSEIQKLALTDSVTGLPNRAQFQIVAEQALENPASAGEGGCLIFIDIDNFKMINDLHGHEYGDHLLKAIAQRILADVETFESRPGPYGALNLPKPCVSRIGGDEFAIFMPGLSGSPATSDFLEKLTASVWEINNEMLINVKCSASIGSAEYPTNGKSVPELMRCADIAMYHTKAAGKNGFSVYTRRLGESTENEIRSSFTDAIEKDQLILEYQPKVCTRRKAVAGAEALVRWNHPTLGRLSPSSWVPAISGTHLAAELGDWVIDRAMQDLSRWNDTGLELKVAVNVSPVQLRDQHILATLTECAKKYGICHEQLELEVTEDALFEQADNADEVLNEISKQGFKISIDDFGTGYSNLSRLTGFPIDFIKIDQSLMKNAIRSEKGNSVLEATISLAKKLDCFVVAEGIESMQLAELATRKGANLLQGYLFSKSLSSEDFLSWLEQDGNLKMKNYAETLRDKAA